MYFFKYFSIDIYMMEEEHGILTNNGWMFLLPQSHFKFKSVNISSIFTSKLKMRVCMFLDLFLGYHLKYFLSGI